MKELLNHTSEQSRRGFITKAASTFLGVGLTPMLGGRAFAAGENASPLQQIATAKRVIYLYMSGGMTHLDTFDLKPKHENQGATKAMHSSADFQISANLPRLAKHGHHLAVINSMYSTTGAHQQARYLAHTSYEMRGTIQHPALGAWLLTFRDRMNQTLPGNVVISGDSRHPGSGFFPAKVGPLMIGAPDKGLQNVKARVDEREFDYRMGLTRELSEGFAQRYDYKGVSAYTEMYDDAVKLMSSQDLKAFDLSEEPKEIREAYGNDKFGQGCLLARRLVENDVRFVEVSLGGWDTHQSNFTRVPERCDILDRGMGALISDLENRGLLNDTLVVLATEFGRTPRINQNVGRDHYPKAFSTVLAGGGVTGGQKYGKTDEGGEQVVEDKVAHEDLNATIAYALGLPLNHVLYSPSKRPFTVAQNGKPITKLFA